MSWSSAHFLWMSECISKCSITSHCSCTTVVLSVCYGITSCVITISYWPKENMFTCHVSFIHRPSSSEHIPSMTRLLLYHIHVLLYCKLWLMASWLSEHACFSTHTQWFLSRKLHCPLLYGEMVFNASCVSISASG